MHFKYLSCNCEVNKIKKKFKNFLSENISDSQSNILWLFIIFAIGILYSYNNFTNNQSQINCYVYFLFGIFTINIIYQKIKKYLLNKKLNSNKTIFIENLSDVLIAISLIISVFILGYLRMSIRTNLNHTKTIDSNFVNVRIKGCINGIEFYKNKYRLSVYNISSKKLPTKIYKMLFDIKIKEFEKHKLNIGDSVEFYASIFPIQPPIFIKDFNYKKYLFYQNISGIGKIKKIINKSKDRHRLSIVQEIQQKIETARYRIVKHIQNVAPKNINGIIVALSTGDRNLISKKIQNNYRYSGISHLLAISGFHMAIIAGLLFTVIRFMFTLIYPISNRYDTKKLTYPIVIFILTVYLFLSGAKISTQRAYIMTVSYIIALMLGKSPISIRLLLFAGFIILLISPESVVDSGFVLSFISVMALITVFSNLTVKNFLIKLQNKSYLHHFIFVIFLSSVTANVATSIPVLYYFGEYSIISLLTNIITIPIFTFAIMPLILLFLTISQITDIFNFILINLLNISISTINNCAEFMANNFKSITVTNISDSAMGLFILGVVIFAIIKKDKFVGLVIMFIAVLSIILQKNLQNSDIVIINKKGDVIIKESKTKHVLTFNIFTQKRQSHWKSYYKHNKISKRFGIPTKSIYEIDYNIIDQYNFGDSVITFTQKQLHKEKIPCFEIFRFKTRMTTEYCLTKAVAEILFTKKDFTINYSTD